MRIGRVVVALSAVAFGLVSVTSCNGDGDGGKSSNVGKDPRALVNEAQALWQAEDFKVTGDAVADSIRSDYDVCVHVGRDLQGTESILGHPAEVIVVGGKAYRKGDVAFWRAIGGRSENTQAEIDEGAARLADKYVTTTADPDDQLDGMGSVFGDAKLAYTMGEISEIGGKRVIALTARQGDETTRTVHVLAEGKPYPVKIQVDGADPVNLVLARAGKGCTPAAPPVDRTLNMDETEAA
ncbi:hypothetical protein B4N89_35040 [Embleya scabrispora]|uniref:Lipoprotein n=1 Tax=Embleya scabrispora TaxID=159449 RepID=A0A1T3NR93_9ACTN|nr:hypothetical protein [Embleya scabrispora]OPC79274.1 hypothetical protein B4N89_35040 [Embleya scabrispora]